MSSSDQTAKSGTGSPLLVSRPRHACACGAAAHAGVECAACRAKRQRAEAVRRHLGVAVPASVDEVLRTPGRRVDSATRQEMEVRFGRDFRRVRLHTDAEAAASARALSARAYALGNHIVFGPEGYSPHSPESRRRLAHELTHVVQQDQGGGAPLSTSRREAEAGQAVRNVASGAPMPRITATTPALSRDDGGSLSDDDAATQASAAEESCDIGALCRLSFRAPGVVTRERLLRAFQACHPEVPITRLIAGNPCLTPNFGLPPSVPAAGPRRAPGITPAAGRAPARTGGGGGGLALPSTTIRFNLGPASVSVDLPSSVAVRLPVPFQGAQRVVFSLNASTSEFSFSVTINAIPHVRISASASATTAGGGQAGLTIQTTRTVCHAVDPAAARSALQSAGTRLHDAIEAAQNPPAPAPGASELERTFAPHARLAEVVGAVAHLKSEIDRVGAPCREVPFASFQFGVQGPLTRPETPSGPGEQPPATYVGGSLRFNF